MNTEEIILTTLLAAVIVSLLLRPFVVRQPAARPVRRRKAVRPPVLRAEAYRISAQARNAGYEPSASPVHLTVAHRKIPPIHPYGRERNSEAYSHR